MDIQFVVNDYLLVWNLLFRPSISEEIQALKERLWKNYSKSYMKLEKEKELFGFYLKNHPTTRYKDKYKVVNISDLNNYVGKTIDVVVLVEKVKVIEDKNKNKMAFITGSDELDTCEFVAFSKEFNDIRDVTRGNILLIRGKVEKRNNNQVVIKKSKMLS